MGLPTLNREAWSKPEDVKVVYPWCGCEVHYSPVYYRVSPRGPHMLLPWFMHDIIQRKDIAEHAAKGVFTVVPIPSKEEVKAFT